MAAGRRCFQKTVVNGGPCWWLMSEIGTRDVLLAAGRISSRMSLRPSIGSDQESPGVSCALRALPWMAIRTTPGNYGSTESDGICTYDRAIPQKYVLPANNVTSAWVVKVCFLERQ